MKEKEFGQIRISEITARAGVNRASFYRNCNSKEDVLHQYLHAQFDTQFVQVVWRTRRIWKRKKDNSRLNEHSDSFFCISGSLKV